MSLLLADIKANKHGITYQILPSNLTQTEREMYKVANFCPSSKPVTNLTIHLPEF